MANSDLQIDIELCTRKGNICKFCKNDIKKGTPMITIRYNGYRQSARHCYCEGHLEEHIKEIRLNKILGG